MGIKHSRNVHAIMVIAQCADFQHVTEQEISMMVIAMPLSLYRQSDTFKSAWTIGINPNPPQNMSLKRKSNE